MPSILTHLICGKRTIKRIADQQMLRLIGGNINMFNLGTQGPDLLFYNLSKRYSKDKSVFLAGSTMHSSGITRFYESCIDYIKEKEIEEQRVLVAYMLGFLCHYALDANTHPYIYYKSGFTDKKAGLNKSYAYNHRVFESALDVILCKDILKIPPHVLDVPGLMWVSEREQDLVCKMYEYVLRISYNLKTSAKSIKSSIRSMYRMYSFLNDKNGRKKRVVDFLEKVIGKRGSVSGMFHYTVKNEGIDYLNREKKDWFMPWDRSVVQNKTFYQLFDVAIHESLEYYKAFFGAITGAIEKQDALKVLGNRSFASGIDGQEVDFLYHDNVFAKKKVKKRRRFLRFRR